jgi:hypothetical protein
MYNILCITFILLWALTACVASPVSSIPQYTSQDLSLLPCEEPNDPFFYPLEFTKEGDLVYRKQVEDIQAKLEMPNITDVFVFVHGWDKTAKTAERDYQDFVCRIRKYSTQTSEKQNQTIIIGIFWPSTFWPNYGDPSLTKIITYPFIRDRADAIGDRGLGGELIRSIAKLSANKQPNKRYHFIAHSFGAKMTLSAFRSYLRTSETLGWLVSAKEVNFVLLLGAVKRDSVPEVLALSSDFKKKFDEDSLKVWLGKVNIYIVHSNDDIPNSWLFPLFEWKQSIGAVGERIGQRLAASQSGYCQMEIDGHRELLSRPPNSA